MTARHEPQIDRLLGLHERGLVTEVEVVAALLVMLADMDDAHLVTSLFGRLPAGFQSAVRIRLNELQSSGFHWKPIVIGPGYSDADLERLHGQLRFIHGVLCSPV